MSLTNPIAGQARFRHALLLFFLVLVCDGAINLIGIDFPIYWHPDEVGKAGQLLSGIYNFNHPQFLLDLALVINRVFQIGNSERELVLSGRIAADFSTAVAVATFAVVVSRRFGNGFGLLAAVLIGLSPVVFVNAHFFKEEATLLMGVVLTMLALQSVAGEASRKNIAMLGLAAGLAASSKYVGLVMLAPCIALLFCRRATLTSFVLCVGCAVLVCLLTNISALLNSAIFGRAFISEFNHALGGHSGVSWGPTSLRTLINFWHCSTAAVVALWSSGMILCARQWLRAGKTGSHSQFAVFDQFVIFMPVVMLLPVQLSALPFSRYVLSASALATLAAVWTGAAIFEKRRRLFPGALLAASCVATFMSFASTAHVFIDQPRVRLTAWIARSLPVDARIAADYFAGLPTPERFSSDPTIKPTPQSVAFPFFDLGSAGSLDQLRANGFTHIVISSGNFDRYFDPRAVAMTPDALEHKRFYQQVFEQLKPIYEEPLASKLDLEFNTRLLVYDIR